LQQTEEEAKNLSLLAMRGPEVATDTRFSDFIFLAPAYEGRWLAFSVAVSSVHLQCKSVSSYDSSLLSYLRGAGKAEISNRISTITVQRSSHSTTARPMLLD